MNNSSLRRTNPVKWLTVTAMLMAMNIIMSSSVLSIPVPGGHLYLNDVIIDTAALLLDPLAAFMVGGIGAFIGDALFYPAPMFVSLVTHGLQAAVIALCVGQKEKKLPGALIGVVIGTVINIVGYSLGRAFVYATPEYAVLKFPFQALQAALGAVAAILLCYKAGLLTFWKKFCK